MKLFLFSSNRKNLQSPKNSTEAMKVEVKLLLFYQLDNFGRGQGKASKDPLDVSRSSFIAQSNVEKKQFR